MMDAACSYLKTEYKQFRSLMIEYNKKSPNRFVTIDDILGKTDLLPSIIESGAKSNPEALKQLKSDLYHLSTLEDKRTDMEFQMNRYIQSGQQLSQKGRTQFVALQAMHDEIAYFGFLYLNKVLLADFNNCSSTYCLLFNEASLKLFVTDLLDS